MVRRAAAAGKVGRQQPGKVGVQAEVGRPRQRRRLADGQQGWWPGGKAGEARAVEEGEAM